MSRFEKSTKRLFDILLSLVGLPFLLLPFLFISLLVKLSSSGPVFFRQKRIGRYGDAFTVVKFRTMVIDSEKFGSITVEIDPRITRVGRFLRRHKLDELPQVWNVLIGKMSFVGPRPDVKGYADELVGQSELLLELRPGITGPASLYFRNEEGLLAEAGNPKEYNDSVIWPKKVAMNLEYLQNWGFWKDIGYIVVTLIPASDRLLKVVPN